MTPFNWVSLAVSVNDGRLALEAPGVGDVTMASGPKVRVMAATDTHRLHVMPCGTTRYISKLTNTNFKLLEGIGQVVSEDTFEYSALAEGNYTFPQVFRVTPTEVKMLMEVNAEEFSEFLKAQIPMLVCGRNKRDPGSKRLVMKITNRGITTTNDTRSYELNFPTGTATVPEGCEFEIACNVHYLLDALKIPTGDGNVIFGFQESNRSFVLQSDTECLAVIMPMALA